MTEKPTSVFNGNIKQVSDDGFYMAIVSIAQREPDELVVSQTDINDYKITAVYHPNDKFGDLPFFSDFVITRQSDPTFKVPLREYKERYMEFRNTILDMVQKARDRQLNKQTENQKGK